MAKIIEMTILFAMLLSWRAYGSEVTDKHAQFVKCSKHSSCQYQVRVNGENYRFVSSNSIPLNQEVYSIFEQLEKDNVKESKPFCVTGKIINIKSKKLSDGKLFKITSIGQVDLGENKTSTPRRSNESMMGECAI